MARQSPRIQRDETRLSEFAGVGESMARARFMPPAARQAGDPEIGPSPEVGPTSIWLVLAAIAALGAGVFAVVHFARPVEDDPFVHASGAGSAHGRLPAAPSPEDVALRYLTAATVGEKVALIRFREKLAGAVAAYYADRPTPSETVLGFQQVVREGEAHGCVGLFAASLEDGGTRLVAVVEEPNGERLVDWECFAGPPAGFWPMRGDAKAGLELDMHVVVSTSDYFNHGFSDPDVWTAFELQPAYAGPGPLLFGYARRGSAVDEAIRTRLVGRQPGQRVILRLRFPQPIERDPPIIQAEILEFVAPTWIRTRPPAT